MTQIEQIKAEIERLKNMKGYLPIECRELYDAYQARGYQYACDDILSFIESLEKAPSIDGLGKAAEEYAGGYMSDESVIEIAAFKAGAHWEWRNMIQ